jgi:NAD(P)-dependent dehydrogenase (short-subunit alcohol dehydrogenase family)
MLSTYALQGKTILVTGASSGIGAEAARVASELGACVIVSGRNRERLEHTQRSLAGDGHKLLVRELSGLASGEELVAEAVKLAGPLSGVVHCAGIMLNRPLRFLSESDADSLMRLNHGSAMGLIKGFRKKGAGLPGGSAVLVASVMGVVGQPGLAEYCASKGAMLAATRALAVELARDSLRVNCVVPGMVRTELMEKHFSTLTADQMKAIEAMHPLGLGQPRDVAFAIAYLLSDAARWITGTGLVIDGGYTAH